MFATALALVTFVAAPVPKGAERDDRAALQGEWTAVALVRDGTIEKFDACRPGGVTFTGDAVRFRAGTLSENGTFVISARNAPASIDVTRDDDIDPDEVVGVERESEQYLGVYRLDGDQLTVYLVRGDARPQAIPRPDQAARGSILLVLVREKKK